jgi:prepilin peptidase CpaA
MTEDIQAFALLPGYFLMATVVIASIFDVISHRIPNLLLAPALSVALLSGVLVGGLGGIFMSLGGLGVGLVMLMPLYVMGAMGAGDVKLLGVAGAFLGPYGALVAGLTTFVAGAVFGLLWIAWGTMRPAVIAWYRHCVESYFWLPQLGTGTMAARKMNSFAYAPAIAVGAAFAIWQQGWLVPTVTG